MKVNVLKTELLYDNSLKIIQPLFSEMKNVVRSNKDGDCENNVGLHWNA